jgi:[acyl-carrier-protein] S-malonyltransferase
MLFEGVDLFVEIGCGKTLSGMNKKIGVASDVILSLEKVADLDTLARCHATISV